MSETVPGSSAEIPGRPFYYYLAVLRRRWTFVVVGLLVGILAGVGLLVVRPQAVTASAVVQLSVTTSDPFGLDRAPSSLLDVGTEQQVARSFLVAQRAAEQLDGVLSPREVRASAEASVGEQATVVTVTFTAENEDLSRAGADAVATSFLQVRGEQVQDRINDQLSVIEDRLLELQSEQTDLLEAAAQDGGSDPVLESRDQLLRNEIQALIQQRTNLNSVSTSGGRVLSAASATDVVYSPSRTLVVAAAGMAGLLAGLLLAFLRERTARRFRHPDEVRSLTGTPVLSSAPGVDRWHLPAAVLVGMLPEGATSLTLINLAAQTELSQVSDALAHASEQDPATTLHLATLDGRFSDEDLSFSDLRTADAAAVIVSPKVTSAAHLRSALAVLGMLDVDLLVTFWSSQEARHPPDGERRNGHGRRARVR